MTKDNATPWKIATGVFALLFVLMLINGNFLGSQQATQQQQQVQPTQPTNVDMTVLADDVVKGSSSAPVTIIIYSDPSCPYCAAAAGGEQMVAYMKSKYSTWESPVPGLIKNYVDTGKARMVFRYFPGHGNGVDAMKIMLCANEQGKFWQVHDVLFNNQNLMNSGTIDVAGMKKLAVDNGVDSGKLETCLSGNKYDAKLTKDSQLGQQMGVQGTPAFFINGQLISGADSFSTFKTMIDAMLQ